MDYNFIISKVGRIWTNSQDTTRDSKIRNVMLYLLYKNVRLDKTGIQISEKTGDCINGIHIYI